MRVKARTRKLGWLARVLIAVAAAVPLLTFLFPLWTYAFDAPQYPEGLMMEIWVHKLGGRVDLINGLNHYVGFMRLEAADFWELKVLPAAVIVTVVGGLLAAVVGTVRAVRWWLIWYGLFAVLGMADFYRWLYKFGNTVDPMAAITMEGYTPPMLGTSQFMNFYITAWPSWGAAALAGGMILGLAAFLFGLWRLRARGRQADVRATGRAGGAPGYHRPSMLRILLKILYWAAVLAVSLALVVALILFLESRDQSSVEGATLPAVAASA